MPEQKFLTDLKVTGTVDLNNLKINTAQGTDGQVLTSTGTGVGWEDNNVPLPLYIDNTNQRVGISEPDPDYKLHVNGQIYSESSTFPVYFLQRETSITGDGTFTTTGGIASGFHLRTNSSGTIQDGFGGGIVFSLTDSGTASNTAARIYARRDGGNTTGALQFWGGLNGESPLMTMRASGNVGIGTSGPGQKLEVNGNVIANRYYGTGSTVYYVDPNHTGTAIYTAGDIRTASTKGFTSDGLGKLYAWRAVDNTAGNGTNYVKIARLTGTAGGDDYYSDRCIIEIAGRSTSYSNDQLPAMGYIVAQLQADANWDVVYYNHDNGSGEVVSEVGVVQISNTQADIYVRVGAYAEVTASGHISDGHITVDNTRSGSAPSGYTAANAEYKVWNSGNDGASSGLDADKLDAQEGSYYLNYNNFANTPTIPTNNNQLTNGANYITNSGGTTAATANTVAKRDNAADINARLFRSNYQNQSTISGAMAFRVNNGADNYTRYCSNPTAIRTFIGAGNYNDIRSLGVPSFTNGTNPNITTAQVMSEIESDGGFDSYSSVFKTSWSYAGNYNLTDAGDFTETAGSSWITWTDNSSDSTRGNITALAIAPNTGGSAGGVFIYNDQGSTYSPGWRQVWTSATDGAGSGLDADKLDGLHATASGNRWGVVPTVGSSGVLEAGKYIDFHESDSHTGDYNYRITSSGGRLYLSGDLEVDGGDIYINDSNTHLKEGSGNSLKVQTNSGYVEVGAQNASYAHFTTDRGAFYFSKEVQVNTGIIRSYDEDLNLNRAGSGTARLRITSGTTISDQALQSASTVRSQFNSGDYSQLESNGSGGVIKALSSGSTNVLFRAYGDSYTLNDFGIGISSPDARLHVYANGTGAIIRSTQNIGLEVQGGGNSADIAIFKNSSGNERFSLNSGGSMFNIGMASSSSANASLMHNTSTGLIYRYSSSIRYKEGVKDLTNAVDKIMKLRPVEFKPKDSLKYTTGMIAEEVFEVMPEITFEAEVEGFDEPQVDGISYEPLHAYYIKAIQELSFKIEQLEARIQTLESN